MQPDLQISQIMDLWSIVSPDFMQKQQMFLWFKDLICEDLLFFFTFLETFVTTLL